MFGTLHCTSMQHSLIKMHISLVLLICIFYQILPVNDEPPQLGSDLRAELSCKEGGQVQITVEYLSATDVDSEDTWLNTCLPEHLHVGCCSEMGSPWTSSPSWMCSMDSSSTCTQVIIETGGQLVILNVTYCRPVLHILHLRWVCHTYSCENILKMHHKMVYKNDFVIQAL